MCEPRGRQPTVAGCDGHVSADADGPVVMDALWLAPVRRLAQRERNGEFESRGRDSGGLWCHPQAMIVKFMVFAHPSQRSVQRLDDAVKGVACGDMVTILSTRR
jgi:myo-inositol catabolism protein IolC